MHSAKDETRTSPITEPLSGLSSEEQATLARIGPIWSTEPNHSDLVGDIYEPRLAKADKSGITVHRDLAYGSHPRQVADIFVPQEADRADVVLFVHGGAFVRGSKRKSGEMYDNVLYWFARQGLVGVNVEYRLAGDAPYPGGAEDIGSATEWAKENIEGFGGNPGRLFIIGHSAGAAHVVGYAFDPGVSAKPGPEVGGIVTMSGRIRADALPGNPNAKAVVAYYGEDASVYDRVSPLTHAATSSIPVFIAIAEFENPYLDIYGAEFFHLLAKARGRAPRFLRMRKHNHSSMAAHFNSGEEILGREILNFFATGK